jgi:phytoene dehydrogenase-like protein
MSHQHDAVVIGSGHNGLTCACYLAKAGMKVLVLEQYATIGGMTNTEELTLPGFHSDTHAIGYQMANLSPVPGELGLHRYGFELLHPEIGFSQAFPDGTSISVFRDIERTCDSIARFSARDADAWRTLCSRFAAAADQIAATINSPPPSPAEQMLAFKASTDGLDEYRFQLQSFRSGRGKPSRPSKRSCCWEPGAATSGWRRMMPEAPASPGCSLD